MANSANPEINKKIATSALGTLVIATVFFYLGDRYAETLVTYPGQIFDHLSDAFLSMWQTIKDAPFALDMTSNSLLFGGACFLIIWMIWLRYVAFIGNYRSGEESGSARWGTVKEGKKFKDLQTEDNNLLFTKNFGLALHRPKFDPEYDRNLNVLVVGGSGSGKTFTMANVIAQLNKPTLIISHNKTLAAQLYGEFKEFFPENAVEYFVSYYDYYQPEAYVPQTDTYIAKDSAINEEIDKLRLSATAALVERKDVIVIASVSCIYGLGSPEDYLGMMVSLRPGMEKDRDEVIRALVDIQYTRNDMDFHRGTFRVRGDTVEIFPANYSDTAIRVEFFGDEIDRITEIDVLTGEVKCSLEHFAVFPASHYVVPMEKIQKACVNIEAEMEERVKYFKGEDKLLEAQRIAERTNFDIEMLKETGFCSGIENYSRHLAGLPAGATPHTLMDYFKDDFLIIVDESHITIPQIGGMYAGDQSRKSTLVDYGFRLPSAKDNRPLNFEEFESKIDQMLFVSATPNTYEDEHELLRAEQIIRPTGLLDPEVVVRPVEGQIDDLIGEVNKETAKIGRAHV